MPDHKARQPSISLGCHPTSPSTSLDRFQHVDASACNARGRSRRTTTDDTQVRRCLSMLTMVQVLGTDLPRTETDSKHSPVIIECMDDCWHFLARWRTQKPRRSDTTTRLSLTTSRIKPQRYPSCLTEDNNRCPKFPFGLLFEFESEPESTRRDRVGASSTGHCLRLDASTAKPAVGVSLIDFNGPDHITRPALLNAAVREAFHYVVVATLTSKENNVRAECRLTKAHKGTDSVQRERRCATMLQRQRPRK